MTTHGIDQPLHSRDRMFERAVRRAGAYRRVEAAKAPTATAGTAVTTLRNQKRPAGDARILRRWSVAELIVSAERDREVAP